jgi:hypothetical protein
MVNAVDAQVATSYVVYAGVITLATAHHVAAYCGVHTTKQDTVSNDEIYNH